MVCIVVLDYAFQLCSVKKAVYMVDVLGFIRQQLTAVILLKIG